MPTNPGKVRLGFVPDEWFQFLYNKTGVTGPYILFWGALTTIFSKEYFIASADTVENMVWLVVVITLSKYFGKSLGQYLDSQVDARNKTFLDGLKDSTKTVDAQIVENEALLALPEANKIIHAAKRENALLQLEAAYRQKIAQVYQEIKKRLDFQLAVQNAYKRAEREQAISYILDGVNKSIGAAQEKEAFQSGLQQLRLLSQKHAGTI